MDMSELVAWKCTHFDTTLISAGTYPARSKIATTLFSDDSRFSEESITNKDERQLVNELFVQDQFRQLLFPEICVPTNSFYKTHVVEPLVTNSQKKPGDIDVLICRADDPTQAVAVECKRVEVTAVSSLDDDVHKINDIKNGANQTKAMRQMGFHRTFLCVIVQVDGRNRKEFNTLFRGLNSRATFDGERKTRKTIYEFPQSGLFHEDVGFIFIEVIQPTGKSFESMGGICLRMERDAKRIDQPSELSNRVAALMLPNR